MKLKAVSGMMLILLLVSMFGFVHNVQPVKLHVKTVYVDDDNIVNPWNGTLEHEGRSKIVRVIEHKITTFELEELKQKVGVWEEGRNYNQKINGHETGLRPPTQEEWTKILEEVYVVDEILWSNQMADPPSSVDHTNSTWFPPIGNQDGEGSCTTWAVGYYMKTFQEAKEHGWNLSGAVWEGGYKGNPSPAYQNRIFSPDFIYHLINSGEDSGSSFFDAINLVCSIGACSWEKMPYDPDDSTSWPSEDAWKEALLYRGNTSGYEYMRLDTDTDITNLKNWIASDHLATIAVDADQYGSLTSDDVWTVDNYINPSVNHANTIVGYDDNIEYLEEGETRHGAFKIANSWGVGWSGDHNNDGCYWISYEAMKQRVRRCYFYRDKIGYEPELVASFKIDHSKRDECDITVGMGDESSPIQIKRFNDYIDGGNQPFCSNNILFDITEFKQSVPTVYNQSFFIEVYDGGSSTTGTINNFAIEYAKSNDPPINTVNDDYVSANVTLFPLETSWIDEKFVCSDEDFIDHKISVATDSDGYLYIAYEDWYPTVNQYAIFVRRSTDGGNTWPIIKIGYDPTHNLQCPSIAIDPYSNDIFVAVEREWTSSDHDILVLRYVDSVWSWSPVANISGSDDRFPSITCEYSYGSANWLYISYEYVYSYNDRDLMFAKSTDHGATWSTKKLHGDWPDYNVHAQTSITNAEGYIYIAYKWGADYDSTCEIRVDRSTDFGNNWTQFTDIDGLSNDCCFPSVAATHGGGTVLVAFQYAWSETNDDVCYSYSTDKGENWNKGYFLFNSSDNERKPAVAVDGEGTTENDVEGYFHAVCQVGDYIKYRKANSSTPSNWSYPEIVSKRWVGEGLAVTTQFRSGSGQFYPCVAWTGGRTRDIYYSTIPARDIAVTNVTPSKTVVGQSYSLHINVTVENQGETTETFNVTTYANTAIIATFTNIILTSGNSATITFPWNTTGYAMGVYTISATATPVPEETNTTDNTYIDGTVQIATPGDLNGDGHLNLADLSMLADHWFGHDPTSGRTYDPRADINGDGLINLGDLAIMADYWFKGPLDVP